MIDPFALLSLAAYPNVAILAVALVVFALGFVFNLAVGPRHRETITLHKVPKELTRLASVLGIKKDAPVTQSYGAMIHDLFEEKNSEILFLKDDNVALEDEVEKLQKTLDDVRAAAAGFMTSTASMQPGDVIDLGPTPDGVYAESSDDIDSTPTPAVEEAPAPKEPKDGVITFVEPDGSSWELDPSGIEKKLSPEEIVAAARIGDWDHYPPHTPSLPYTGREHYRVNSYKALYFYGDVRTGKPSRQHLGKTTLAPGHYFAPSAK